MQRSDRWIGTALAVLAAVVLWTARSFPNVPGQKVGAGFLPLLVGAGLLVCGLALVWRSRRGGVAAAGEAPSAASERLGPALVVLASVLGYVLFAERVGFLIIAPLMVLACCRALGTRWGAAVLWSLAGTAVVHVAFYKFLRVPLPWGVLRPFY